MSVSPLRLQSLDLWLQPADAPLLPQLRQALAEAAAAQLGPGAEPLRWAITAVDPLRGLRLEGVLVGPGRALVEPDRSLVGAEFALRESDRGLADPEQELVRSERGAEVREPRHEGRERGAEASEPSLVGPSRAPEAPEFGLAGPEP